MAPQVRARAACATAVTLLALAAPAGAVTYYGPELAGLTRQSVDVLKMHQYVLGAQLDLDATPFFFELAIRSTPAEFQLNDGSRTEGGISRYGLSFGGGFGRPSELAAFAGVQVDQVALSGFPNFFVPNGALADATHAQFVAYGGLAALGVQFSYGVFADSGFTGLDAHGRFAAEGTASQEDQSTFTQLATLTWREGVSLGGSIGDVDGETVLAALRAKVAPRRWLEDLDLAEYGVPSIGLNRYAESIDYYGDLLQQARDIAKDPEGAAADAVTPEAAEETYEIPLGVDDVLGTGVRLNTITQVRPEVLFRLAEAGYQWRSEEHGIDLAGRAFVFRRGEGYEPSAEAFVAFQPEWFRYFSIFGVPRVTLSYSYNTPEATTFLPIPDAHVIGAQWVYGPVEMGRPLVPLVTDVEDGRLLGGERG